MVRIGAFLNKGILINLAFAGIGFLVFYAGNISYETSLRDAKYFNGWVLVACMSVLFCLTIRKKVVILPFGRVRKWLLLHYYLGFVTVGVFLVHTKFRIPDSALEWFLWVLFVLIALSGIFGGLISKSVPARLEAHGERILFERIPMFKAQLAAQAEELVLLSVKNGQTLSISKLYTEVLADFFARHRNIWAHLQSSKVPIARLHGELDAIERYLDDTGKAHLARLRELVKAKDNLDFHYANGGLLKLWLFFHIPTTYALILAIVVHVMIAYAFSTGIA